MTSPIHDLVDLTPYPFRLDIRYARSDNFMGTPVYPVEKAFLQKPVAEDLAAAHQTFRVYGFGILVFDGYRPWSVTKRFWDWANEDQRRFFANPATGSTHNRGCAVDCSLFHLDSGKEVEMPSAFDELNEKAWSDFSGGNAIATQNRDLFIEVMHRHRFKVLKNEWWHFNHECAARYPILDLNFLEVLDGIRNSAKAPREGGA